MKLIPRPAKPKLIANSKSTVVPLAAVDSQLAPLAESAAAQVMWLYYREHKLQLITDIRDYRADILSQLMVGVAVEVVFAPYFKPPEPVRALRRAA